jgi:hypothetical protein
LAPHKETYTLIVRCKNCDFQVSREVEMEPENLVEAKKELVKQAAAIHKKHPDVSNFMVM